MAGRIAIAPSDNYTFNVFNVENCVLLIWNDGIYSLTPDEASRLGNMLTTAANGLVRS